MKFAHQNRRNNQTRKQKSKRNSYKRSVASKRDRNRAKSEEFEETHIPKKHAVEKRAELSPCFHCFYSEPDTVHMCPGVRCAKYKAWKHSYLQYR